jgi:Bucentaur or craniofacial development
MPDPTDVEVELDNDYDEEADSDFDAVSANSGNISSSSEGELDADAEASARSRKRQKVQKPEQPPPLELDSGDEATIKEHTRTRLKQKKKGDEGLDASGEESEGWRARTRAMRDREKEEKKRNKLATVKGSTINVNKLWEGMNRIGFIPKVQIEPPQLSIPLDGEPAEPDNTKATANPAVNKENDSGLNEIVTIKRSYKFAGEIHIEEKTVLKSSAEARLWLAQQSSKPKATDAEGRALHRPLRKISRFDPNFNNLESFKGYWTATAAGKKGPAGPKLNVVEKSKMDWAVHVDAEGLKEELDVHAKAKEGYLNRMDFLRDVEQRKEVEARGARLQGQ